MRLSSAVMFVSDLDSSISFYCELLDLTVSVRDETAALLVGHEKNQLYLRGIGPRADHPLGAIGIQYLIWSAEDVADLDRCEKLLWLQSDSVTRNNHDGFDVLEGPGPDGVPIMIVYPGPESLARDRIIPRIYSW